MWSAYKEFNTPHIAEWENIREMCHRPLKNTTIHVMMVMMIFFLLIYSPGSRHYRTWTYSYSLFSTRDLSILCIHNIIIIIKCWLVDGRWNDDGRKTGRAKKTFYFVADSVVLRLREVSKKQEVDDTDVALKMGSIVLHAQCCCYSLLFAILMSEKYYFRTFSSRNSLCAREIIEHSYYFWD